MEALTAAPEDCEDAVVSRAETNDLEPYFILVGPKDETVIMAQVAPDVTVAAGWIHEPTRARGHDAAEMAKAVGGRVVSLHELLARPDGRRALLEWGAHDYSSNLSTERAQFVQNAQQEIEMVAGWGDLEAARLAETGTPDEQWAYVGTRALERRPDPPPRMKLV